MKTLTLLLSIFTFTVASAQVNTWVQKATYTGSGSNGTIAFSIGSKGYLGLGGVGSTEYNDLWEYDPSTNNWIQKASFPGGGRRSPSVFVINNKAYVFGGFDGNFYSDLWEYDPTNNSWLQKTSLPTAGRYGAASFAVNGKGYITTGNFGTAYGPFANDLWEYDPANNSWLQKASVPVVERYGAVGFSLNDKGYISCGVSWDNTYILYNDLWEYDPSNNSWTAKANLPAITRDFPVALTIGSKGFVGFGNSVPVMELDWWEYDPANNQWTQRANCLGAGRFAASGFSIDYVAYVGTGYDIPNNYHIKDFWAYTAITGIEDVSTSAINNFCHFITSLDNTFASLEIDQQVSLNNAELRIYNAIGQIIDQISVDKHVSEIDIAKLSSGAYFYYVKNSEQLIGSGEFVVVR